MIAQLDLFAEPVARATVPAPPPAAARPALSPNGGTAAEPPAIERADDEPAAIAAERARLHGVCTRGREVVEVDPKRLDRGGDIDRSYSAQSLMEKSAVSPTVVPPSR